MNLPSNNSRIIHWLNRMQPAKRTRVRIKKEEAVSEYDPIPGVKLVGDFRIQSKSLLLTYSSYSDEEGYRTQIRDRILPSYCKDGKVILFEIVPGENGVHHVLLLTSESILTRIKRVFEWKNINPDIRVLRTPVQIEEAKKFVGKEDAILLVDELPRAKPGPKSKRDKAIGIVSTEVLYKSEQRPKILIKDFRCWQIELLELMNKRSSNTTVPQDDVSKIIILTRTIHVLYTTKNNISGRTTFLMAIKYEQPERFLIIKDVPCIHDLSIIAEHAKKSGWNGDSIIFDVTNEQVSRDIHETLKVASDEGNSLGCNNVWVFINWIPDPAFMSDGRWKFFRIYAKRESDTKSSMSSLESMNIAMVREKYQEGTNVR